jgi:hypothetical protein
VEALLVPEFIRRPPGAWFPRLQEVYKITLEFGTTQIQDSVKAYTAGHAWAERARAVLMDTTHLDPTDHLHAVMKTLAAARAGSPQETKFLPLFVAHAQRLHRAGLLSLTTLTAIEADVQRARQPEPPAVQVLRDYLKGPMRGHLNKRGQLRRKKRPDWGPAIVNLVAALQEPVEGTGLTRREACDLAARIMKKIAPGTPKQYDADSVEHLVKYHRRSEASLQHRQRPR